MTPRKLIRCIFCDRASPRAREDVFPKWMSKEFKGKPPFTTDHRTYVRKGGTIKRSTKDGSFSTLKLKEVCTECNGVWMSRLEKVTQPILEPLIRGERTDLTGAKLRQLAAWAQLKCLTLDAYYLGTHKGTRHLPASTAHTFGQHYQPLANSLVRLGICVPPEQGAMLLWGRQLLTSPATAEHTEIKIVIATFAFGHLILQVLIGASSVRDNVRQLLFPASDQRLIPCWPLESNHDISWPPRNTIPPEDFDLLAQSGIQ